MSTKNDFFRRPSALRFLVIDAEPLAAAEAVRALSDLGEVVVESAAATALERLDRAERFDVIFCEIHLRHLTGADFYKRARYFHPAAAIRTVFVTAVTHAAAWASLKELGRPVLAKPYETRALRDVVEHVTTQRGRIVPCVAITPTDDSERIPSREFVPAAADSKSGDPRNPFGPWYPQPLQAAVARAERTLTRVSEALNELLEGPAFDPADPTEAEVWLLGREDEIKMYVTSLLDEWKSASTSIATATETLERYLDSIDRGFHEHVGPGAGHSSAGNRATNVPTVDMALDMRTRPDPRTGDTPSSC